MYRRVVRALYGGCRGRTAGALPVTRYTDYTLKCFSLGNVHCSENKPPEDQVISNPSTEGKKSPKDQVNAKPAEEKVEVAHKKDSSQPPPKEALQNIISGMKVEVSSSKRLAAKRAMKLEQRWSEMRDGVESVSKMFQKASKRKQSEEKEAVGPEMAAAVSAVASTFPDQKKEVESELLRHLLYNQTGNKQEQKDLNISKVISGMQVKPEPKILEEIQQRGEIERMLSKHSIKRSQKRTGKRLNIFPDPPDTQEATIRVAESESSPTLWDLELAKEIAIACEQPVKNGFEEMIQWTNEGKLWTFPINNDAGLDEEQNVEFHEHIFLDRYLEDFPKQGPIRHFMELVVCGLSKNPFLTVQQKKEHIDWFRDYFKQKEEILKDCEVYLN